MLDPLDAIVLFIFGTILGSFLNALAFRYNSGKSMWGRSVCMTCNKKLEPIDLVPILSYLFLIGKCRRCRGRISMQYPIVEIIAGILTILAYVSASTLPLFLLTLAFFQILLFISIYDIRHTIIPDAFVYTAALVALIMMWVSSGMPYDITVIDPYTIVAGPFLALPLVAIWYFSKQKAMGLGDAKLFLAVGWFLGIWQGAAAFMLSFWIGAIVGLILLALSRGKSKAFKMKSELPFGPFIAFATALVYFLHIDFFTVVSYFA